MALKCRFWSRRRSSLVLDMTVAAIWLQRLAAAEPLTVEDLSRIIQQCNAAFETCMISYVPKYESHRPREIPPELQKYYVERALEAAERRRAEQGLPPIPEKAREAMKGKARATSGRPIQGTTYSTCWIDRKRGLFRLESRMELPPEMKEEAKKSREDLRARLNEIRDEKLREDFQRELDPLFVNYLDSLLLVGHDKAINVTWGYPFASAVVERSGRDLGAGDPLPFELGIKRFLGETAEFEILGQEGLQDKIHYVLKRKPKPGQRGLTWKLWFLPERGWCVTRAETPGPKNALLREIEGFDWREAAPGLWFPMRVVSKQYAWKDDTMALASTEEAIIKEIKINPSLSADLFTWSPTRVTRVRDRRFDPPLEYDASPSRQYNDEQLVRMHMERKEKAEKLKQEREQKQQAPKQ